MESNVTIYLHLAELAVLIFSATLIPVIGWLIQKAINGQTALLHNRIDKAQDTIDEHRAECDKISKEVLDVRLQTVETEIKAVRRFNHWVGNTLTSIATKLEIKADKRPDADDI